MTATRVFDRQTLSALVGSKIEYKEFLRVPALHCGIYHLPAGAEDPQQPHAEDEIYYVLAGRGEFESDDGVEEIAEGSVLYVKAGAQHKFANVSADLTLLVIFAANAPA